MLENMKSHGDLHLARKIFHLFGILGILMAMIFLPTWLCWSLYLTVGLPLVFIDYFRRHSPALNRFCLKIMGPVARKHEVRKLSGSSWAIIGIGLVFFIFPKPISYMSVLFLAVGDPTASFFGLLYGKTKILGKKSFAGTIGAFVFCSIAAFVFLNLDSKDFIVEAWSSVILISLACGAIGAISELLSIFQLDDNLSQPLISGLLLSLLFWQVGGVVYG